MSYMFGICKKMTGFRGRFNTSQVTDMSYMFIGCNNLKTLDLSSFNSHGPGECHQSTMKQFTMHNSQLGFAVAQTRRRQYLCIVHCAL